MGGNQAWSPTRYCILARIETERGSVFYDCYNLDKPENNDHLHRVENWAIKQENDPSLWHGQHYFIQDEIESPEAVEAYKHDHLAQAQAKKQAQDEKTAELDRLEAIGRELWPRLIGPCKAVIVAEHEKNTSDGMSDYYGSITTARVILAPSKHTRDLFAEMRKAAERIPETQHLGVGKGRFTPYVKADRDFNANGSYHYQGERSHWHQDLEKRDENYNLVPFLTRAEAEAYIEAQGEPYPINFGGENDVSFSWDIEEREIEHREKYTGGNGYYLGYDRYSGWNVSKIPFYDGKPSRELYIDLARRHDHLESGDDPRGRSHTAPQRPPGPWPGRLPALRRDIRSGLDLAEICRKTSRSGFGSDQRTP